MKCFETFRNVDTESGVENWRAYFTDDCAPNQVGDWMPKPNAPVGRGDTELEAIANLCDTEQERLNVEAIELDFYAARLSPMTALEWECLDHLYREGTQWGVNIAFKEKSKNNACWALIDKGYVERNGAFYISKAGIEYYEHYNTNRQRIRYS